MAQSHTDFRQPSILIYEPKADGSLDLVAVESLVFTDAWRAAGHTGRPTFHGVPYDAMADDPARHSTRRTCSNRTSTGMSGSIAEPGGGDAAESCVTCAAHQVAKIHSHHGGSH